MTNEIFQSKNGIRIEHGYGKYIKRVKHNGVAADSLGIYMEGSPLDQAVAEFYQARRDKENGVYRSKSYPSVTVRVVDTKGVRTDAPITDPLGSQALFRAYDEASGRITMCLNREAAERRAKGVGVNGERVHLYKAIMEFLDANPVRKPVWHEAKPGEAWLVSLPDGERVMLVDPSQFTDGNEGIDFDDPDIAVARRIWPESD